MSDFDRVTIIGVEGSNNPTKIKQACAALNFSQDSIKFARSIFFSPTAPPNLGTNLHVAVPAMTYDQYNEWMLRNMVNHIETDFVLTTQRDGFVVHPAYWNPKFLEYDYIGAPWPFQWPISLINRVGNGGFSLRSKRLLEYVAAHYTKYPFGIEDKCICEFMYADLVKEGFKFAPFEVACQFSFEWPSADFLHPERTFGFHAQITHLTQGYYKLIQDE